jgi:hypothetical protein
VILELKDRRVEPEKTAVARGRLGKEFSAATDMHATIEELLEAVFSIRSVQRLYTGDRKRKLVLGPRRRFIPRLAGRLIVGRIVTLT